MRLLKKNIPSKILDSHSDYFLRLEGIINSVDELASGVVHKGLTNYKVRITPSTSSYFTLLLQEIIIFHKPITKIEMSKSMKRDFTIYFEITL